MKRERRVGLIPAVFAGAGALGMVWLLWPSHRDEETSSSEPKPIESPGMVRVQNSSEPSGVEAAGAAGEGRTRPVQEQVSPAKSPASLRWMTFRLSEAGLELLSSEARAGTAKKQRVLDGRHAFRFTVRDAHRRVLWESTMRDPRRVFYDLAKDDANGELRGGEAFLPAIEFPLRLPELEGASTLEVVDQRSEPSVRIGEFPLGRPAEGGPPAQGRPE